MGIFDYILTSATSTKNSSTVYQDDTNTTSTPMTPESTSKKKAPKMLRELQEQLTDKMLSTSSPRKRRRISTSPKFDLESPTKKRIISFAPSPTSSPSQSPSNSNTFSSPPPTPKSEPSLIHKPVVSLFRSSPKTSGSLASPPVTPTKHQQQQNQQQQKPQVKQETLDITKRKLIFEDLESNKENIAPKTQPITPPITPQREKSIFAKAKSVFHRSYRPRDIETLPERDLEAKALREFFIENITQKRSTSLYISGPPGTGKTAQINLTLSQFIETEAYSAVKPVEIDGVDYKVGYTYINCMTVNNIKGIFSEIYTNLCHKKTTLRDAKKDLLALISNNSFSDMNIIVLDELDKLITEDQQVLFELFAWTILESTNLILIGISNALDMVDRLLPRLKTNGLNPNTLVFMPYTSDQIASIIRSRLRLLNSDKTSNHVPLFHPAAIQLCSKKSASNSGDLRKALDICRNAVELLERGLKTNLNNSIQSNDDQSKCSLLDYDEFTAPQVKITHIAKVCSNVFNQNQSMKLKMLNLQQKIMLCMLIKAEESNPFKTLDLNSFFEFYIKNSNGNNTLVGILRKGEFLEIVSNMESIGVLRITSKNIGAFANSKVSSTVVKKDMVSVVEGTPVLKQLLGI